MIFLVLPRGSWYLQGVAQRNSLNTSNSLLLASLSFLSSLPQHILTTGNNTSNIQQGQGGSSPITWHGHQCPNLLRHHLVNYCLAPLFTIPSAVNQKRPVPSPVHNALWALGYLTPQVPRQALFEIRQIWSTLLTWLVCDVTQNQTFLVLLTLDYFCQAQKTRS